MVTSPPYHVGKDYDTDASFDDYLAMLSRVFAEVLRVLEPGGRAVVNVANLGRRPYLPLSHLVTREDARPRFPDARRDHLAEGSRCQRQLRMGQLAVGIQPGGSGRPRVLHGLLQGRFPPHPTRNSPPSPRRIPGVDALGMGDAARVGPHESGTRRHSPSSYPDASSSCTPTKAIWCSIPSSEAGQPQLRPCSQVATTWVTRSTPRTSRWQSSGSTIGDLT